MKALPAERQASIYSGYLRFVVTAVLAVSAVMMAGTASAATIRIQPRSEVAIQTAINRMPASGGIIEVTASKPIVVARSIVIAKDNVTVDFRGATLQLKSGANVPVVIIGEDAAVPATTHRNIRVKNVTIDGNRAGQTSETSPANPALRNNGISMRKVENCSVENVTLLSCSSGGLVTELGCRGLALRDIESSDNQFDGLAAYQTEDSLFTSLSLRNNHAAGFSFDIQFNHNLISDCVLSGNGSVGIFMRDSRFNVFTGLQIRDSAQHGVFLAQVDADASKPAAGNVFTGCVITDSGGAGIRVNDASCVDNVLSASELANNTGGGISQPVDGLLTTSAVVIH